MPESFFEVFGKSKIPSLLLMLLLCGTGAYLIKGEDDASYSCIAGAVILIIATTLAIFSFADYRKREETKNIIEHYESALQSISTTHSKFENQQQDSMTEENKNEKDKPYNLEREQKTLNE